MKKVMFVCTGNICRSAMAEFLLKKKLDDLKLNNILVCSAGTYACEGETPTYEALNVMKNIYGIDMSTHIATPIRNSKIEEMDLVLCMTNSHKNTLTMMFPHISDRIFLLKEYVGLRKRYFRSLWIWVGCL